MSGKQSDRQLVTLMMALSLLVVATSIYHYAHAFLLERGWTIRAMDSLVMALRRTGMMSSPLPLKGIAVLFLLLSSLRGRPADEKAYGPAGRRRAWAALVAGAALYVLPAIGILQYAATTLAGYVLLGISLRTLAPVDADDPAVMNDDRETFRQNGRRVETKYSVNLRTTYRYQGQDRNGWINVVNPFRGTMVLGIPGSGKSYSVFEPFIEQMIRKRYSLFVYDYKYPALTSTVYNELLQAGGYLETVPEFYTLNFNDPQRSHRCNPLDPEFITDLSDATEIADIIFLNVNKGSMQKDDFFTTSAKELIASMIWKLKKYRDGIYCDIPHLIELAGQNYEKVLYFMASDPDLEGKTAPFIDAHEGGAQDQLQGQMASVRTPLNKLTSPVLYWVLSGNDIPLDINDPKAPKILCVGNDSNRQGIYGVVLALIAARLFKVINHKGKNPCGVLLDELPTVFIKGLDHLINTARSNKVAVVLGAQDKSQLIRDYGEANANVIFDTVGNHFVGAVAGRTAQDYSRSFGKEYRRRVSRSMDGNRETRNVSYQQVELLSVRKIENLEQGEFCGRIANEFGTFIRRKPFCAAIERDNKAVDRKKERYVDIPVITSFDQDIDEEQARKADRERISRHVTRQVTREWAGRKGYSNGELVMEVADRVDRLTEEECRSILDGMRAETERERVNEVVMANFYRIKEDVREMMEEFEQQ